MNLYQKLIEIRKSVPYLQKDNKGHQFNYVSSSQTLGSIKRAMDEHGVLLVPEVVGFDIKDHVTSKGAHWYFTVMNMKFTWVNAEDPNERVVCGWTGQGLDDGEKGVGKALTYAEKYFILKFFNIPTDKDDPDSFQKEKEKKSVQPVAPQEEDPRVTKKYDMHPGEAKDVPEIYGEEQPDEEKIIKSLKEKLGANMLGFKLAQKREFFDFIMNGRTPTVDILQDFIDHYLEYRTKYMASKEKVA